MRTWLWMTWIRFLWWLDDFVAGHIIDDDPLDPARHRQDFDGDLDTTRGGRDVRQYKD